MVGLEAACWRSTSRAQPSYPHLVFNNVNVNTARMAQGNVRQARDARGVSTLLAHILTCHLFAARGNLWDRGTVAMVWREDDRRVAQRPSRVRSNEHGDGNHSLAGVSSRGITRQAVQKSDETQAPIVGCLSGITSVLKICGVLMKSYSSTGYIPSPRGQGPRTYSWAWRVSVAVPITDGRQQGSAVSKLPSNPPGWYQDIVRSPPVSSVWTNLLCVAAPSPSQNPCRASQISGRGEARAINRTMRFSAK